MLQPGIANLTVLRHPKKTPINIRARNWQKLSFECRAGYTLASIRSTRFGLICVEHLTGISELVRLS
jgi:hypothetical protein